MKKNLLLLLLPLTSALAQEYDFCKIPDYSTIREIDLAGNVPQYFFKAIPPTSKEDDRLEVSLISGGSNWVVDMKTGATRQVPGPYDAVPTPDGEFITIPANRKGIEIFDRDGLDKNSPNIISESESDRVPGVYQSAGILDKKGSKATYRVISDGLTVSEQEGRGLENLYYKDYDAVTTKDQKEVTTKMQKPKRVCSNISSGSYKLPMLSKTGNKIALYDVEERVTKIFNIKIGDNGEGQCELYKNLGFATSKVEFNFDDTKITFNADSSRQSDRTWDEQPLATQNNNVFVLDLKTEELKKVSHLAKGNAYYPSFMPDGTVTYLSQETSSGRNKYYIKQADISQAPTMKLRSDDELDLTCMPPIQDIMNMAIGKLWHSLCQSQGNVNGNQATRFASEYLKLSLDPKQCKYMVEKYWEDNKSKFSELDVVSRDRNKNYKNIDNRKKYYQEFLNISESDLLKTCPTDRPMNDKTKKTAKLDKSIKPSSPYFRCMECHNQSTARHLPFQDPQKMKKHKRKAIMHVLTGFMPKGIPLTDAEFDAMMEYLESLPDN